MPFPPIDIIINPQIIPLNVIMPNLSVFAKNKIKGTPPTIPTKTGNNALKIGM